MFSFKQIISKIRLNLVFFIHKSFARIFVNRLPVRKNKIVFQTMNGLYGCNPKYICEEIIRRRLPYDLVWITDCTREAAFLPKEVRIVPKGIKSYIERATSRIMICNGRTPYFSLGYKKKGRQTYIQTWHGSYGIKKAEGDILTDPLSLRFVKADSKNIDCLISCSAWATGAFLSGFFVSREVIFECGSPRNDIFFTSTESSVKKVREYFQLDADTKIALYAPTFRDNKSTLDCYSIDYRLLEEELTSKFGGKWVVIARLHPALTHMFQLLPNTVINGCSYPDMQELMCATDFMISDYSSCIFDFMLSRRPGFIFATDIDEYNNERGFYYPLQETPFPIAVNNEQLADNIRNFDRESYETRVEAFLLSKGARDDGHAVKRCVDFIESKMNA